MCQDTEWGFHDEYSIGEDHKEIHIKYDVG